MQVIKALNSTNEFVGLVAEDSTHCYSERKVDALLIDMEW